MAKKAPEEAPDPQALLPLTPAVFHIMLALADGERHGYGIMLEVERLTSGRLNLGPGTLYRSIQRMLLDGLIEETKEAHDSEEDDDAAGITALRSSGSMWHVQSRGGSSRW